MTMRDPVVVSLDALMARIVREQIDDALRAALAPIVDRLDALAAAAPPALVSVEVAAERLQLSPATVRRQLASGDLPGVRLGGRWKVDLAALSRRCKPEEGTRPALEAHSR
jgi:excisionase family DNA binding protein